MRFVNGSNDNNLVGPDNVFAHNTGDGIEIDNGTGNRISANSIHDNGGKGILLADGEQRPGEPDADSAVKAGATRTSPARSTSAPDHRATSSSTS